MAQQLTIAIQIFKDGSIKTLYRDNNPCRDMGIPKIHRASNVEFNNEIQKWEILENGSPIGHTHKYRADAIREEIEILEGRMFS